MLLQSLNILENFDLKSMGYNSAQYMHTLYQTMNLTFADRDFYYGDPYFTKPPIKGLLSKEYAKARAKEIDMNKNNPDAAPGNPYPYEGATNPYTALLQERATLTDTAAGKKDNRFLPKHDTTGFLNNGDNKRSLALNTSNGQIACTWTGFGVAPPA